MTDTRLSSLVRWSMLATLALFIAKVTIDLVEHPLVLSTAGKSGSVLLILLILALLIYAWFALFQTSIATAPDRITLRVGAFWGLFCGAAWAAELLIANLPSLRSGWFDHALYFATALAGYLLPMLAGLFAARLTGRLLSGLRAGLLCGMAGGLIILLTALLFSGLFNLAQDPQTIAEFQRSGLPDITTYIVGDMLAALIAHLWIGLLTGSFLGFIGGAVGKAIAPPPAIPRPDTTQHG